MNRLDWLIEVDKNRPDQWASHIGHHWYQLPKDVIYLKFNGDDCYVWRDGNWIFNTHTLNTRRLDDVTLEIDNLNTKAQLNRLGVFVEKHMEKLQDVTELEASLFVLRRGLKSNSNFLFNDHLAELNHKIKFQENQLVRHMKFCYGVKPALLVEGYHGLVENINDLVGVKYDPSA